LIKSVGLPRKNFCLACFTGEYPIPVQLEMDKLELETMEARRNVEVCDAIEDA
jgi:amidophosphoribosyltransferase